jgi:tripartite-type tricarboxylate transporter receptor subunit TctC
MFAVHPKLGVGTVAEFLEVAKTREINFSSAGNGSPGHVAAAMLTERPARRSTTSCTRATRRRCCDRRRRSRGGDRRDARLLQHVQAGKLKALAVTSRSARRCARRADDAEAGWPASSSKCCT